MTTIVREGREGGTYLRLRRKCQGFESKQTCASGVFRHWRLRVLLFKTLHLDYGYAGLGKTA